MVKSIMNNIKDNMFRSKRFIAFSIACVLFVTMLLFTEYPPMELAGSISLIAGIYIGGETLRSSTPTKDTTITTDSTSVTDNITTAVNTVETKKN